MKKYILAVLLLCVVGIAQAATLSLKWTYDYVANPACSATVTRSCVTGFEYGTTPDGGTTLVKIGQFSTAATIQSFTQAFPYGPVMFYMRTMAVDSNGATVYSLVSLAPTINITASAVKSFTVTITAQ